ncbi:LOW QUALITY PROTEIN: cell cycle regulator protein, putative [Theileria annulata]|uniref:Cell cycle regulator protein, putative n=1 Tax=Theileria annulata TaxID=5874 RepID=Q4UAP1_THEAN|nr:LOW QUALITY PROTEIN: cell cycle regulator protein, putative [Theileria annulata]CAI76110.1 cell cycle regulator protein, putative [Theileria annulata]|eukprot:XP_952736.1 LOW QUALITY PROTEIN: cell cycle regulator protein, putative [Theileria annulata]
MEFRRCLIWVRIYNFEMVKKFSPDDIISQNLIKTSVQRNIKLNIVKDYPLLKDTIDVIFPKKIQLYLAKCQEHVNLLMVGGEIMFIQHRDGPWIPSLRLVHKYPDILPKMQVDSGAIKFVLRGSNIMCPGLTSEGGKMDDVEADTQVTASGRHNACAIGLTTMSTKEIALNFLSLEKNKDVCIHTLHYLNDGYWQFNADKYGYSP